LEGNVEKKRRSYKCGVPNYLKHLRDSPWCDDLSMKKIATADSFLLTRMRREDKFDRWTGRPWGGK